MFQIENALRNEDDLKKEDKMKNVENLKNENAFKRNLVKIICKIKINDRT